MNKEKIKDDYLEAVRLYLWYNPSKFSFHSTQKSKEQASRWLKVAHQKLDELTELNRKEE